MVGHDDAIHPKLCSLDGIVDVDQSLDDQLAAPALAEPGEIVPSHGRIEQLAHSLGDCRGLAVGLDQVRNHLEAGHARLATCARPNQGVRRPTASCGRSIGAAGRTRCGCRAGGFVRRQRAGAAVLVSRCWHISSRSEDRSGPCSALRELGWPACSHPLGSRAAASDEAQAHGAADPRTGGVAHHRSQGAVRGRKRKQRRHDARRFAFGRTFATPPAIAFGRQDLKCRRNRMASGDLK